MDATLESWPLAAAAGLALAALVALWRFRRQALAETGRDPERMARAVASARRAAAGASRERSPRAWARARMQLVMLLAESGARTYDTANYAEALAIVTEVAPVLERQGLTAELATALYYKARAEWGIAMSKAGTQGLETAVATLHGLLELEPWPRHLLRAVVVSLPAVILIDIGERRDDVAVLEEGVALAREAAALARRRIAVEWAIAHRNLCHALAVLGRRQGNAALLEKAVEAGRAACAAIRPGQYPEQWALSQASLGQALCTLGELRNDGAMLEDALSVVAAARRTGGAKLERRGRAIAALNAGSIRLALARATGKRETLEQATSELRAALAGFEEAGFPFPRAETARLLGDALAALGDAGGAEAQYRLALEIFVEAGASRQQVETRAALAQLGEGAAADRALATHTPVYQVR